MNTGIVPIALTLLLESFTYFNILHGRMASREVHLGEAVLVTKSLNYSRFIIVFIGYTLMSILGKVIWEGRPGRLAEPLKEIGCKVRSPGT